MSPYIYIPLSSQLSGFLRNEPISESWASLVVGIYLVIWKKIGGYWKCEGYKTPPDRKSDVTVGGLLFVWANTYLGL